MRRILPLILVAILLVGCAYRGGAENPVVGKFSYFSMLNGDDIRERCGAPEYERYRLVYNGLYSEQVRIYELRRGPKDGHVLTFQISKPANLAEGLTLDDMLKPWRPVTGRVGLDDGTYNRLVSQLEAGGFGKGAPKGLELASESFWWLAVGCRAGRVDFHAWRYPSPEYAALIFDKLLFGMDNSGVKVNPPRDSVGMYAPQNPSASNEVRFNHKVGENGLVGVSRLF
ncbi:MAG: hypothetical protein IT565_11015 [Rhodospirillales bacterium]|nr:hypothetical protein [Rhodospirillales bacterium]